MKISVLILLLFLSACTSRQSIKQKTEKRFNYIAAKPQKGAYLDKVLNELDDSGHFISLKVSNRRIVKRLIIENGRFFSVYSNDEKSFHKEAYIEKVKPYVQSEKVLALTDEHWLKLSKNMLDMNDQLMEKQYRTYVATYFRNNLQAKDIEQSVLLQLADYAFRHEFFISKNDISGYYLIDSAEYLK